MAIVFIDENGQICLDDPEGLAVAKAVAKHNCKATLERQSDRVEHFRERARQRGDSDRDVVIVLANVDTPLGGWVAEALMPGYHWQQFRDRGEIPFARGLAGRDGMQDWLAGADSEAAEELEGHSGLAVVVVDHGTVRVF